MASPRDTGRPGLGSAVRHQPPSATHALINRLWPAIAPGGARVVAVSSGAHGMGAVGRRALRARATTGGRRTGRAKAANVPFAVHLDALGRDAGVRAFAVHPGSIPTPLQRHLPKTEMVGRGLDRREGQPDRSHLQDARAGRGDAGMGGDLPAAGGPGWRVPRGLRHRRAGRRGLGGRRACTRDRPRAGRAPVGPVGRTHGHRRFRRGRLTGDRHSSGGPPGRVEVRLRCGA